jgi:hypothetical protein
VNQLLTQALNIISIIELAGIGAYINTGITFFTEMVIAIVLLWSSILKYGVRV